LNVGEKSTLRVAAEHTGLLYRAMYVLKHTALILLATREPKSPIWLWCAEIPIAYQARTLPTILLHWVLLLSINSKGNHPSQPLLPSALQLAASEMSWIAWSSSCPTPMEKQTQDLHGSNLVVFPGELLHVCLQPLPLLSTACITEMQPFQDLHPLFSTLIQSDTKDEFKSINTWGLTQKNTFLRAVFSGEARRKALLRVWEPHPCRCPRPDGKLGDIEFEELHKERISLQQPAYACTSPAKWSLGKNMLQAKANWISHYSNYSSFAADVEYGVLAISFSFWSANTNQFIDLFMQAEVSFAAPHTSLLLFHRSFLFKNREGIILLKLRVEWTVQFSNPFPGETHPLPRNLVLLYGASPSVHQAGPRLQGFWDQKRSDASISCKGAPN